jgi:hypothetical protein
METIQLVGFMGLDGDELMIVDRNLTPSDNTANAVELHYRHEHKIVKRTHCTHTCADLGTTRDKDPLRVHAVEIKSKLICHVHRKQQVLTGV